MGSGEWFDGIKNKRDHTVNWVKGKGSGSGRI